MGTGVGVTRIFMQSLVEAWPQMCLWQSSNTLITTTRVVLGSCPGKQPDCLG